AQRHGDTILTAEGTLFRARLREIIFQQPQEKNCLNQLLHPLINARTQKLKLLATSPYVLWVVPLVVENGLQHQADP
ncbi:dephospho-CoA kinase, partial [Pantoea sp. GbtcB22]|uniref:dephospho-CoA kinase n=1 Tax=Pantoea sp. GbtcB22 TaxID=2824767 RepID=UPI001C30AE4D